MAQINRTSVEDLFVDAEPPSNFVSEVCTFEPSESDETACLLSRQDSINILPQRRNTELSKGSITYVIDRFDVYKPKNDKFGLFHQQNEFLSENCFNCPVCFKKKQIFFCPNCVRNGDFTHSKTNFLERFADKKLKFIKLKSQQIQISNLVQKHYCNSTQKDDFNLKIRETEKNLNILKKIITEKKNSLKDLNSVLNETKRKSLNCHQKHLHLKSRINDVKNLIARQNVALNNRLREKANTEGDIQLILREKLCSLTAYIYQLSEENVNTLDDSADKYDTSFNSESTPLLCLSTDSSPDSSVNANEKRFKNITNFTKYKIVEPWIASNETFQLHFDQPNRMEYLENNFRNDEYRITSALSYLCHLTNLIAIFCDIHLPKKLLFSEFYFKEFKKEDLLSKIAKLNTNIIFLCIYHRIDPQLLHPKHSFRNLQFLLNSTNHVGILDNYVDISSNFYKTIQDNLVCDLNFTDKEEFDDSSDIHDEREYDFVENNIPDLDFNSNEPTGVNLLSFVSSFYRRTTGQR